MVSDLKFFAKNCVQLPRRKKFFTDFFLLICSLRLTVLLPTLPEVQCPKFLDIWNPWGKVMERSGLKFEHFSSKIV